MKKIVISLGVLLILTFSLFLWMSDSAKKGLDAMVYEDIDMSLVQDGIYSGVADVTLVRVKIEVSVKDHKISKLNLVEHQNGMGSKAEAILEQVIEKNRYDVDAIAGATLSSEAIKSAISKALKDGYAK